MVKKVLILIVLALSVLLVACGTTEEEAVRDVENGRIVTVFHSPT